MIQARTFPQDRSIREPWYDAPGLVRKVFDPNGPPVRRPDGGWDAEAKIAEAGLVTTTRALLEFADEYVVRGSRIGSRRIGRVRSGWWGWQGGTLSGTNSLVYQSGGGVNNVILFNRRAAASDRLYHVRQFMEILNARLMLPSSASSSEMFGGASTGQYFAE